MIQWGPTNHTVLPAGATARLPCPVWGGGNPVANVGWLKDGNVLVGAEPRASLQENGSLRITSLRVSRCSSHRVGWGKGCSGRWVQGSVGVQGGGCSGVDARGCGCKG